MKKIVTLLSLAFAFLHTPVLNLYAQPFIFTPGNELNYHHSEGSEMNISAEDYSGRQNNSDSSILYFGNWKLTPEAPGFYCNDFKSSNTQFNKCIFAFKGSSVKWFGSRNNNHGYADIYLDNVFLRTIDSYSPALIKHSLLFEKNDLEIDKIHTLMIVVRKEKDEKSIDCYQDIDYFETNKPYNYVKEISRVMNEEYSEIQNSSKIYAMPSTWKPVPYKANVPQNGVKLLAGPLADVFYLNIKYLNHCFASPTYCDGTGWSEWLPASVESRLLTGAANALRWEENDNMRKIVDTIIGRIKNRVRSDGYHNYYPEDQSFALKEGMNSERKNYDRVFWTRGMVDAGRAGSSDAYKIVRNFYNWFNSSQYLPYMLLGSNATNGFPGGGLVYHSKVGTQNDLVITERYFDQDYWIKELEQGQPLSFSNYPGERPHCYDLLGLEAFLDEYIATGIQKYIDGVKGGWQIYNHYYEHAGGSTAICEGDYFPPGSYYLNSHTGETCGTVFWMNVNSKLHQLYPDEEKYVAEIEKSIYNVIMAIQDTTGYIRYHNNLNGQKDKAGCAGTCCEVSSTAMMSKLPELIYSVAGDGLYINLFAASEITSNVYGNEIKLTTVTNFPDDGNVTLKVSAKSKTNFNLRIRIPSWTVGNLAIYLNGKQVATGVPGTYVSLNRKWSDRDKITFLIPMKFSMVRYTGLDQVDGNYDRYALLYGPLLMSVQGLTADASNIPKIEASADDLPGILEAVPGSPLRFNLKGYPELSYVPYWQVQGKFTCFPIIQK